MTESIEPEVARKISVAGKEMTLAEATTAAQSAANWFWWVAGLSLVNSVSAILESNYGMILGLGITQIFDAFLVEFLKEASGGAETLIKGIHVAFVGAAAGFFYLMGVKARALRLWAFVVGMLVYTADGLIFVFIQDWIGVGFHVFVLFMLWGGYGIAKEVVKQSRSAAAPI